MPVKENRKRNNITSEIGCRSSNRRTCAIEFTKLYNSSFLYISQVLFLFSSALPLQSFSFFDKLSRGSFGKIRFVLSNSSDPGKRGDFFQNIFLMHTFSITIL